MLYRWFLVLFPLVVIGQTSSQYTVDQAVKESDVVYEGEIRGSRAYTCDNGWVMTEYDFFVFASLKGEIPDNRIIQFTTFGGVDGDYAMETCPSFLPQLDDYGILLLRQAISQVGMISPWMPTSMDRCWVDMDLQNDQAFFGPYSLGATRDAYERIEAVTGQPLIRESTKMSPSDIPEMLTITGISPSTSQAGRGQEVTITGTGFGATQGVGLVRFRNVNAGPTSYTIPAISYTSWTDTEIRCIVPARAGTGYFRVQNNVGLLSSPSTDSLTITYNVSNVADTEPRLIDDESDNNGGYIFVYSNNTNNGGVDFTSIPAAVAAVERSVRTWNSGTSFAIYGEQECGTSSVQTAVRDNVNLITFDNDVFDIDILYGSSTLGVMQSYYSRCGTSEWEKTEMDMVLRRDGDPNRRGGRVDWEYGPSAPTRTEIDFESVVLHEFGHGHGLGHTRVDAAVMFPSITIGSTRRALHSSETNGGGYIQGESKAYTPPTSFGCPGARQYDDHDPSQLCSLVFPLDLLSFTATAMDNDVQLSWETANEIDHDFIVLQWWEDGRWKNLAKFEAKGNDQTGVNLYEFEHKELWPAEYLYRLKIVAIDGSFEVSEVRSAVIEKVSNDITIQNKGGKMEIEYYKGEIGGMVQLISLQGTVVEQRKVQESAGVVDLSLNLSGISSGVYFLQIIEGNRLRHLHRWIHHRE